jgi:ABC-type branched-subunit amino acid transport system ATPase component
MHFVGALCEHVIVLNFGRRIAEGRPDEIREDPLVREAYFGPEAAQIPEQRHVS